MVQDSTQLWTSATESFSFVKFSASVLYIGVYFWDQDNVYAVVNENPHPPNLAILTTWIETNF